jgi:putative ABC transport system permease protein
MSGVYDISRLQLATALLPIVAVMVLCFFWKLNLKTYLYAAGRMLLQLFLIGFVLLYIFKAKNPWVVLGVILVMFSVASWISLRPIPDKRRKHYFHAWIALVLGGGSTLALILFGVVDLTPWYEARYAIPLAGMIFANSMNGLSLAAERFDSEISKGESYLEARNRGFATAMLPITNNFFAVGLVAFPGMMTGQILAGISPLIAARYQIMVMSMIFGATGLSTAIYLATLKSSVTRSG